MTGGDKALAVGAFLTLTVLLAPWAWAGPYPLPVGVAPGDEYSAVLARCREQAGGAQVTELFADRHGDLVPALIDSGMLAMLNRAEAKHTLFQKPGGRKVSFLRIDGAGDGKGFSSYQATLAFAAGRLEAVLITAVVPPDGAVDGAQNPFSPERLAPVLGFRKRLGKECALEAQDRGSVNRFDFAGKCGRFKARVEYRPEEDSFIILLYQ
jgi:hypothetical protein